MNCVSTFIFYYAPMQLAFPLSWNLKSEISSWNDIKVTIFWHDLPLTDVRILCSNIGFHTGQSTSVIGGKQCRNWRRDNLKILRKNMTCELFVCTHMWKILQRIIMDSISATQMRCVADGQHVVQGTECHNLSSLFVTQAYWTVGQLCWWGLAPYIYRKHN